MHHLFLIVYPGTIGTERTQTALLTVLVLSGNRKFHPLGNIGAMVADALQIVDYVEQGTGQMVVIGVQVQTLDLDQVLGDLGIEEVDHFLVVVEISQLLALGVEEIVHGKAEVVKDNVRHAVHFFEKLLHGHGGRGEQAGVEVTQTHGLQLLVLAAHDHAGQLFQQVGSRQQQNGHGHVEDDVNQSDLEALVVTGQHLHPVGQRQEHGDQRENDRADTVEQKVNHGSPLGGLVGAHGGHQRGNAGTDVLAEEDVHGTLQGNCAGGGYGLQNTNAGRGGLHNSGDQRTYQHAHDGVGGGGHHVAETFPVTQGRHGGGHGIHAHKQHAKAQHDLAQILQAGLVARQQADGTDGAEDHAEIQIDGQHQGGDGGTDVGTHDDTDGLRKLQQTGIDKADHHNGCGRRGLDDGCDQNTGQHAQKTVLGESLQQFFHAVARCLLQTIAHGVDAVEEQAKAAHQLQKCHYIHAFSS